MKLVHRVASRLGFVSVQEHGNHAARLAVRWGRQWPDPVIAVEVQRVSALPLSRIDIQLKSSPRPMRITNIEVRRPVTAQLAPDTADIPDLSRVGTQITFLRDQILAGWTGYLLFPDAAAFVDRVTVELFVTLEDARGQAVKYAVRSW
jgi:hypothetical protein